MPAVVIAPNGCGIFFEGIKLSYSLIIIMQTWLKKLSSHEFESGEVMRDQWNDLLKKEQDITHIHFDLENNNDVGNIKRISIPLADKSVYDNQVYYVEMMSAGGDWENPVNYFRIQVKSGWDSGNMFIFIPPKNEGNHSLVQSKHGFMASHADGVDNLKENDDKECWKSLNKFLADLVSKQKYSINTKL